MTIAELDQARRDRLLLICKEGASGAGSALATFVGKPDAALDVQLVEAESAQALARHVAGDEAVVVGFELKMGGRAGTIIAIGNARAAISANPYQMTFTPQVAARMGKPTSKAIDMTVCEIVIRPETRSGLFV